MHKTPIEHRFWTKVNKNGIVPAHRPELGPCWEWTAATYGGGYGLIGEGGRKSKSIPAHRQSWLMHKGPIPIGVWVLHKCDVKRCVNPAHLFLGTRSDNVEDMVKKGRHGRMTHPEAIMADKNPNAKLTWDIVRRMRKAFEKGEHSQYGIAKLFGQPPHRVYPVLQNKNWLE